MPQPLTKSAQRAAMVGKSAARDRRMVAGTGELLAAGVTRSEIAANLAATRWQRCGRAIVLHSGELTREQRWRVASVNCGRNSVLTAFTAAEFAGLAGWLRPEIHVLDQPGARKPRDCGLPIRLHRTSEWPVTRWRGYRSHIPAAALIVAASSLDSVRPACAILAAAVQQRLVTAEALLGELAKAGRTRHHAALVSATLDIGGGAQALSEIDFVRLCRRYHLPPPVQQLRRLDSAGRNRYLDATWRRRDGRLVVAEVDGALHLEQKRWWDDQLRQNELSLANALLLRFPSVIVRTEPGLVAAQLRRALGIG